MMVRRRRFARREVHLESNKRLAGNVRDRTLEPGPGGTGVCHGRGEREGAGDDAQAPAGHEGSFHVPATWTILKRGNSPKNRRTECTIRHARRASHPSEAD